MKIEKLVIYGFGKHQDRTIAVDSEMSIFYGANEAGKTTIQQFIIQTLFGYPARNQNMPRYEPKSGGKYGGQLHINDEVFGRVIIERVKGKSAGDVAVYFEDGTRGADAELRMVLRDYDRTSFESIFSFSIHELQGLERMTEDELSRTLLASGTTGVDAVTKLESRLEKEMALVFKKSGRNPEINRIIEELKKIESELKEYKSRTELYEPFLSRIRAIEKQLLELEEEEKRLSEQVKALEKWQQAAPLMDKKSSLEQAINEIAISAFPADGRRRMDRLTDKLSEVKAKADYMEKEKAMVTDPPDDSAAMEVLEQMLAREPEWLQLRALMRQKKEEAAKLADEQQRIFALVGMSEEDALQADVSLNQEERLFEFIKSADLEEEEIRYRDRKLTEEKNKLAEAEKELKYFLSAEPAEEERKSAEAWVAAQPKLAQAKAAEQLQQSRNSPALFYLLIALGVFGMAAGIMQADFVIGGLGLLAAAGGAWIQFMNRKAEVLSIEDMELLKRFGGKEAEFEALMQKLDRFDRKLDDLLENVDTAKRKVHDLSGEAAAQPAKIAYGNFLQQLGLQPSTSRSTVLSLFENLREAHSLYSRAQRINEEIAELTQQLHVWIKQASEIYGKPLGAEELYPALRSEFNFRKQKVEERFKQLEKNAGLQAELEQLSALSEQIQNGQQHLLEEAGALSVEEFYRFCDEWGRKAELERELAPIDSQLKAIGSFAAPDGLEYKTAENHLADYEEALQKLKEERRSLLAEQAEKRQTTKALLEDEAHEDKLQQFEEKKEELAELARRWSIDKAIHAAIHQTMEELKEKKLPSVITAAQGYFNKLTSGAYSGLEMDPQGFFEAVRNDGMRFHIAELSQATKEQAYISLRLSLAVSMKASHPFPLIMDDAFVHFDRSRLQQMINLITELQANHQFIYFTCHEAMPKAWPNASVIDVATIERSVQI